MHRYLLAFALVLWAALPALGQECPKQSATGPSVASEVRTLEGTLVYHNSIRKWFELKFDRPVCGQKSTELVLISEDRSPLQVLRGCRVRSTGEIDFSPTGYYSLDTFQNVEKIEPNGPCEKKPPIPKDPVADPDPAIRAYRVDMRVDYGTDSPIVFRVSSAGKELHPWQAYASYYFTGGFVLYGDCGEGFVVDKVFGTPQARPSHFEEPRDPSDKAVFDPESAAASGVKKLHLVYTCVRLK